MAELLHYTRHPGRTIRLNYTEEEGRCQIFFLTERDTAILRALVAVYPKYYWLWGLDGPVRDWDVSQIELWDNLQSVVEALEAKLIMGCDSEAMVTALQDINGTLKGISLCTGTSGAGQTIGNEFYYGSQSPLIAPSSFGGEGDAFGTEAAYIAHKCEAANAIVDGLIYALNSWSVFTLSTLTVGAIGVGLAAIFVAPPLAAFLALAAYGLAFGVLATVASEIDDNRQDLVCALFNADSAVDAYDGVEGAISGLVVDLGFIEVEVSLIMTIVMQLIPIDTMNVLFDAIGLPVVDVPIDCDTCAECESVFIVQGSEVGPNVFESEQEASNGWQYVSLNFNYLPALGFCGQYVTVSSISFDAGSVNMAGKDVWYRAYDNTGNLVVSQFDGTFPETSNLRTLTVAVRSLPAPDFYAGHFQITVNWSND